MWPFHHILIATAYGVAALSIAFGLPKSAAVVPPLMSAVLALSFFLLMAFGHHLLSNWGHRRAILRVLRDHESELETLRHLNHGLLDDLATARQEMAELADVVEVAATEATQAFRGQLESLQIQLGDLGENWPSPPPLTEDGTTARVRSSTEGTRRPLPAPVAADLSDAEVLDMIRDALEENRVDLYLQPIVSLPQRKTRYYEAFARLRTAEGRMILPEDYIAVAEAKKLISVVDNLLLFRCVQLVRRAQKRRMDVQFFVNISSHTLHDSAFLAQFTDFLMGNRKLAGQLIFEFAHESAKNHSAEVEVQLQRLSQLGFRFSIDRVEDLQLDFQALASRNIRYVKIPARTVLAAAKNKTDQIDPMDLKDAADRANIDLICAKIESEKEVVEILDYRFDFGQGYLFGAPRPARSDF